MSYTAYKIESVLNCHHELADQIEDTGFEMFNNNADWWHAWKNMGDYNTIGQAEELLNEHFENKIPTQYTRALGFLKQYSQGLMPKGATYENLMFMAEIFILLRRKFHKLLESIDRFNKPVEMKNQHAEYLRDIYTIQRERFKTLDEIATYLARKVNEGNK